MAERQSNYLASSGPGFNSRQGGNFSFLPRTVVIGDNGAEPQSLVSTPKYIWFKSKIPPQRIGRMGKLKLSASLVLFDESRISPSPFYITYSSLIHYTTLLLIAIFTYLYRHIPLQCGPMKWYRNRKCDTFSPLFAVKREPKAESAKRIIISTRTYYLTLKLCHLSQVTAYSSRSTRNYYGIFLEWRIIPCYILSESLYPLSLTFDPVFWWPQSGKDFQLCSCSYVWSIETSSTTGYWIVFFFI